MSPNEMLEGLTLADKVRLMEAIWDDLRRSGAEVAAPDWHGEIVASRLARVERGEAVFRDWDEVKRRLLESRHDDPRH